ncbi:MAG: hypothetical protein V4760_06980 [Bdellovibrionota bacterium]
MGTKVTNLTLHDPKKAMLQGGTPNSLVVDDYRNGFKVERYQLLEGGLGIAGKFWFENSSGMKDLLGAGVGLIPLKASKSFSVQYAQTQNDLARLPKLTKAPTNANDLNDWSIGDSIQYTSEGGLIYFGSIGIGPASLGTVRVAKGSWSTFVEKATENVAYVRISKTKLTALSASAGAGLVSISKSNFNDSDNSFSFVVDIKSEKGRRVYEDLVRGNLAAVQTEVKSGQVVRQIDAAVILRNGKLSHVFLGLPILLNETVTKGTITNVTKTDLMLDQAKVNVTYGIYLNDQRNRFLDTHASKTVVFYGAKFNTIRKEGTVDGMFGKYSVTMGDDTTSNRSLKNMASELVRKSGLDAALAIRVPKDTKMDFGSGALDITFSKANTETMMSRAAKLTEKDFVGRMMTVYSKNFDGGDVLGLCANKEADCADKALSATKRSLSRMHRALAKMQANLGNDIEFTKAYAEFGREVSQNGMMVQAAVTLAGAGVGVYMKLEGERISTYEVALRSTGRGIEMSSVDPSTLRSDSVDPRSNANQNRGLLVGPGVRAASPVNNR